MEQLIEDLVSAVQEAFQSEEYRARTQEISNEFEARSEQAFAEQAQREGILLLRTPAGYILAPAKSNGQPMGPEDFEKLSDREKVRIQELIEKFSEQLKAVIRKIPIWKREAASVSTRLGKRWPRRLLMNFSESYNKAIRISPR